MKKILVVLPVLFCLTTSAQQSNNDRASVLPFDNKISSDSLQKIIAKLNARKTLLPNARLLHTFSNGTRMYTLSQDNMPCLVPDQSDYNMPVVGKTLRLEGMPPRSDKQQPLIPKTQ
jgi:hypothetical protein